MNGPLLVRDREHPLAEDLLTDGAGVRLVTAVASSHKSVMLGGCVGDGRQQ